MRVTRVSRFEDVPRRAWLRLGWLLTTVALGGVVVATAWANYQSALVVADGLIHGEAQRFHDAVLDANRDGVRGMESVVVAHRSGGLRYVAWVDTTGRIVGSGGKPMPDPLQLPANTAAPTFERIGSRVRVYFPPPVGGPPAPPRVAAASTPGGPAVPRPQTLVMEFEPFMVAEMLRHAQRALVIGGFVAVVLVAGGLAFSRMSQRIEDGERRMGEQRRLTELGTMSAVLAHEIRNPLASLKGHAQLLVERLPADTGERRGARRVVEEAARIEALASDLLDFSRAGPLARHPVDPAALLRTTATELSPSIEIDTAGAPDRWPLDARRFGHSVLTNLIRNALQASPAPRPPQVGVRLDAGQLLFTVRDFGPGLPVADRDRLFEPFFTTRTNGTGLGLAVARRIVELHGGWLEAADAEGGGARFTVILPPDEA